MSSEIIRWIRHLLGTTDLNERLERIEKNLGGVNPTAQPGIDLEILPGTEYSRYALPLEYPPSRSFTPRYGYSHEKIPTLEQWFISHERSYTSFLDYMRTIDLTHIPISLPAGVPLAPSWTDGPISAFDSLALYAMVRKYKPKTYLEIGSGMTTCLARQSIKDASLETKIISIDPEPRGEIDAICDEVIRHGLETCDLSYFDQLEPGDVVFFDGSHRSFMNSDVTVFFIDILPRIKPGIIIHLHDIMLPWDYPDSFKYWYWNEQYLLAVYLMCSMKSVVPLLPTAWVCRSPAFADRLSKPFVDLGSSAKNASWLGGGSMWFTKIPI